MATPSITKLDRGLKRGQFFATHDLKRDNSVRIRNPKRQSAQVL